jgi:GNAT superfamily N-acetyltransferase
VAFTIRDAGPTDQAAWAALWQGYLDFYRTELAPGVTEASWARLMDPGSALKMRLAVEGDRVLGFAIHLHHASTWVLGDDCYLEDLFVVPDARGQGLGRALIEDLMALARTKGWHRIWWMTEITNSAARKLYDRLAPCDDHIRYRKTL